MTNRLIYRGRNADQAFAEIMQRKLAARQAARQSGGEAPRTPPAQARAAQATPPPGTSRPAGLPVSTALRAAWASWWQQHGGGDTGGGRWADGRLWSECAMAQNHLAGSLVALDCEMREREARLLERERL